MQMRCLKAVRIVALCTAPLPLFAQSFGGSFDSGPAAVVQSPSVPSTQNPSDTFGGSFGGSFDTGATGGTPTPGQPPVTGTAPTVGGSDFSGGSFGPAGGQSPGAHPPVTSVQPPAQQVTQPPPQNQQQPGLQIDPQVLAFETRDWGIPPTNQLRNGQFHAATPTALPGGALVSTQNLAQAMQGGVQMVLIDVLGGQYTLPNAYVEPGLAQAGQLNDAVQQQARQWLNQITGGRKEVPIVIFCSDPQCWLSYNAALRAVAAGHSAVYWYRGGIHAWQMAGLPMRPAGF